MPEPKKAGDLGALVTHLRNLATQIRNKDYGSAAGEFFAFIAEVQKAYTGQTLVFSQHATQKCGEDKCDEVTVATHCDDFANGLSHKTTAAEHEGADAAPVNSIDWASLLNLIMQIAALFAARKS